MKGHYLWLVLVFAVVANTTNYDLPSWDAAKEVTTVFGTVRVGWDGVIEAWSNETFLLWRTELPLSLDSPFCQISCACPQGSPCVLPIDGQLMRDSKLFKRGMQNSFDHIELEIILFRTL